MTILVTGASGFLGGHLVQALVKQGKSVRVLIRKSSRIDHLDRLPIEICYGDLSDADSLRHAVQNTRLIFHCAALSSDWGTHSQFYAANVIGVKNLLNAAMQADQLERFVHISTSDVYGYPKQPCDETYPLTDIGLPYNSTKVSGEKAFWQAWQDKQFPVTIIRPVSIYGPRGTEFIQKIGDLLQDNFMAIFDGGHTHAGLLYVDNAVDFIIRAASAPIALGQAYTLRDDIDISWRAFVDAFAEKLNVRRAWLNLPSPLALRAARLIEGTYNALRIHAYPVLTRHAVLLMCRTQGYAIEKAKRDLDFQTTVGFEEGLDRSVAWFRSQKK